MGVLDLLARATLYPFLHSELKAVTRVGAVPAVTLDEVQDVQEELLGILLAFRGEVGVAFTN